MNPERRRNIKNYFKKLTIGGPASNPFSTAIETVKNGLDEIDKLITAFGSVEKEEDLLVAEIYFFLINNFINILVFTNLSKSVYDCYKFHHLNI